MTLKNSARSKTADRACGRTMGTRNKKNHQIIIIIGFLLCFASGLLTGWVMWAEEVTRLEGDIKMVKRWAQQQLVSTPTSSPTTQDAGGIRVSPYAPYALHEQQRLEEAHLRGIRAQLTELDAELQRILNRCKPTAND